MPRRNPLSFPSYQNLCIYHELAYLRRTQTAVAPRVGLSQRRVSEVAKQVRAWVDLLVKPRHYIAQPGMRFHLAIAQERIRLKDAYEPLIAMFTGDDGEPRYLRRYVAVVDGEALNTIEISEKPDFRLLNQALKVQTRLAELEAIANRGPFADLPSQVHQTIVHRAHGPSHPLSRRAHPAPPSDQTASPPQPSSNGSVNCSEACSNYPQNPASGVLT
jgi:hypothetical protein